MIERNLESELEQSFIDLQILPDQQKYLKAYFELLGVKDKPTRDHCIRVGLKCKDVAVFTNITDPKSLYYPGLLHDAGKLTVKSESLKKVDGFSESDMQELKSHVMEGYKMLRGHHDFSANVLLYHHWFQGERSYPDVMPEMDRKFSRGTEVTIMYLARLLSVVDFWDAATTRANEKFTADGTTRIKSPQEVRELILKHNPDQKYVINRLYDSGIFI